MNAAYLSGEENSDEMKSGSGKIKFKSNNAGGILGGISSGQEIIASFAVKPTSSIVNSRETIDKKGKNVKISVRGRHDPCVGIRAVPIGEAMLACVLLAFCGDFRLVNSPANFLNVFAYALREARDGSQRGCRGTGPPARESFPEGRVFEGFARIYAFKTLPDGRNGLPREQGLPLRWFCCSAGCLVSYRR